MLSLLMAFALVASTCIYAGSGQSGLADQEVGVIAAVAPVYLPQAVDANLSGEVIVDVEVNQTGSVTSTNVIDGNPVLGLSALKAAKRWQFASSMDRNHSRSIRIRFIFHIAPKGTSADELTPIFRPSYTIEVYHLPAVVVETYD